MIKVSKAELTVDDVESVLYRRTPIHIESELLEEIEATHQFLVSFSKNKTIYGINTGLGPMAQYRVNDGDFRQLQLNLIRSHCTGIGRQLTQPEAKACMLARFSSFLQAKSGVHVSAVVLLKDLINLDITPIIYEHGGVGASGDLVQLAHLALFMIGEGFGYYKGNKLPASEIYAQAGLQPIQIHLREGLAIMNGTSAMTGLGLINLIKSRQLLDLAVLTSALINELVESYDDHFSEELNQVKSHPGQLKVAACIRNILTDSTLIKKRKEHLYVDREDEIFEEKVQEYYSIRCTPQILGPVYDTILQAEKVLLHELNSANDNPIVDVETLNVYHGGNFHGDYVSFEMDKLKIAISKLCILVERQLNYLLNHRLNEKFPPFLNLGTPGLNLGLQGMQFTATSTTAENQTLSYPMYLHNIPSNGDNQDVVSMGFNAALLTGKVIENAFQVLAIQLLALGQAFHILNQPAKLSKAASQLLAQLGDVRTPQPADEPLTGYIEQIKALIYRDLKNENSIWSF